MESLIEKAIRKEIDYHISEYIDDNYFNDEDDYEIVENFTEDDYKEVVYGVLNDTSFNNELYNSIQYYMNLVVNSKKENM